MRRTQERWLSLRDVGDYLAKRFPRVAKLNRKRRNEYAGRLIKRVEKRDEARYTKRVGVRIFVSLDALEAMLPVDVETVSRLETNFSKLNHDHRALQQAVNGQGARLRETSKRVDRHEVAISGQATELSEQGERLSVLEEKQALTAKFMADYAALDGRTRTAQGPQPVGLVSGASRGIQQVPRER